MHNILVPDDFDRDGRTDITVWRPSNGFWYVLRSSSNTLQSQQWGQNGDIPLSGDYDGDRINDFAVFRPNDPADGRSRFYILQSNFNFGFFVQFAYGLPTDKVVPGDYDGDGKTDIAVWRPSEGNWYIIQSGVVTGSPQLIRQFGQSGDVPQPADYDGDRRADLAVFRPGTSQGSWFINNSQTNTPTGVAFGLPTDQPVTSPNKIQ